MKYKRFMCTGHVWEGGIVILSKSKNPVGRYAFYFVTDSLICRVFQNEHLSTVDFKKYLLAEYLLQKAGPKDDLVVLAFKVYYI